MLYERIKERLFWYRKGEAEKSLLRSKIYYRKERKVVRKSQKENTAPKVKTPDKERKDTTKVILTREHIKSARTANGGLTKHQLEAIGIEWPLKKGSIKSKIGTEITQEQLEQFLTVKYVKKGKKKYPLIRHIIAPEARWRQQSCSVECKVQRRGNNKEIVKK